MQNTVYYLAVDIGASSGRHILGHLENGVMKTEELYRFTNGMKESDGRKLWDTEYLFSEIINGMKRCQEAGKIPVSMSVDTWAVDYVLLDDADKPVGDTYAYRDRRTDGMDEEVYRFIDESGLYARTGIQKQKFNTIYQLMAVKKEYPEYFNRARTVLMLPDYFQFRLTGIKKSEYTNATSTQLVNPETKQWDLELISMLGYPKELFLPLELPGTVVGNLTDKIRRQVGFDTQVVLCASHDTASAVMAAPSEDRDILYISSGTWSLMGTELPRALKNEQSRQGNFTNEGGYDYRFRYLKNIMGLWMIQCLRHELGDAVTFEELCRLAQENQAFLSRVDVNDGMFLAPDSMTEAVRTYCRNTNQAVPETTGELAAVIYQSLAACYADTVREIERNTGKTFDSIHIIGGGSHVEFLNQMTADLTGKTVFAGLDEATSIGNIMAQMIRAGVFANLSQARSCVKQSFAISEYKPKRQENRNKGE